MDAIRREVLAWAVQKGRLLAVSVVMICSSTSSAQGSEMPEKITVTSRTPTHFAFSIYRIPAPPVQRIVDGKSKGWELTACRPGLTGPLPQGQADLAIIAIEDEAKNVEGFARGERFSHLVALTCARPPGPRTDDADRPYQVHEGEHNPYYRHYGDNERCPGYEPDGRCPRVTAPEGHLFVLRSWVDAARLRSLTATYSYVHQPATIRYENLLGVNDPSGEPAAWRYEVTDETGAMIAQAELLRPRGTDGAGCTTVNQSGRAWVIDERGNVGAMDMDMPGLRVCAVSPTIVRWDPGTFFDTLVPTGVPPAISGTLQGSLMVRTYQLLFRHDELPYD